MVFKPGQSGNPKGRKPGTGHAQQLLLALHQAFREAGGVKWLEKLAAENPAVFAQLLGKVLPRQVQLDVDAQITTEGVVHLDMSEG
jgi:hypothetical protein